MTPHAVDFDDDGRLAPVAHLARGLLNSQSPACRLIARFAIAAIRANDCHGCLLQGEDTEEAEIIIAEAERLRLEQQGSP